MSDLEPPELPKDFTFRVDASDGAARTGAITMPRGKIRTPAFMPVGTAATVKAMYPGQVRDLGADVVLGNTYHLMLRPGPERMARLGGLHRARLDAVTDMVTIDRQHRVDIVVA